MLSLDEGRKLVEVARATIESYLKEDAYVQKDVPKFFYKQSGVFVTLRSFPNNHLRGCIGFTEPAYTLLEALQDASVAASTSDPRFPPVTLDELGRITVEVTVLTPPVLLEGMSGNQYLDVIKIGRDGLIIEKEFHKGLLLPQVPLEWGWDKGEYISQTCIKAGLPPDAWFSDDVNVYTFSGQIFSETKPRGAVVEQEGCD